MKKVILSILLISSLISEDDFSDDFSDDFAELTIVPTQKEDKNPISTEAKLSLLSTYNYIDRQTLQNSNNLSSISSLKGSFDLDIEYKISKKDKARVGLKAYYDAIYRLKSDDIPNIPDTYQSELEIGEAYVAGSISDNLDYKIGRQIVVWGKSDSIRVNDMLNPMDNRNPGIVDIEDLRLPVAMAKFDYYVGDWQLGLIDIFEYRNSKMPEYGSGYIAQELPNITKPEYEQQYAIYLNGRFNGWDLSFYAVDKFNDNFYLDVALNGTNLDKAIEIDRVQGAGVALSAIVGVFLFKTESMYLNGVQFSDKIVEAIPPAITSFNEKNTINSLLGVDVSIPDGSISIEISDIHIFDYESALFDTMFKYEEDTITYSIRYNQSFQNDTISLNYLILMQGSQLEDGGFNRAWINYKHNDNLSYDIGLVSYFGGESFFYDGMSDNDKAFINARYSF